MMRSRGLGLVVGLVVGSGGGLRGGWTAGGEVRVLDERGRMNW